MEKEFQTGSAVADKSFEFAFRIVNLVKYLRYDKKEYVLSKQLLRSGTSIGACVHLEADVDEILRILTAICKTTAAVKK